jgi:hypothetical protein
MISDIKNISIERNFIIHKINELTANLENIEKNIHKNNDKNFYGKSQINFENVIYKNNPNHSENIVVSSLDIEQPESLQTIHNSHNDITFINIFEGVVANSIDEVTTIILFYKDNKKLTSLLYKMSFQLTETDITNTQNFIDFLNTYKKSQNNIIKIILDDIKKSINGNLLNLLNLPLVINVIINILNINLPNFKYKYRINSTFIELFIILFIHVLINTKILLIEESDFINIEKLLSSSILLLHNTIKIPKKKCFPCIC